MSRVAIKVLTTVTAPYGGSLSAHDLAGRIADPGSAERCDPLVFAFFSEVSPGLQQAFIDEMHVDPTAARQVVARFSELAGYSLPFVGECRLAA